MAVGGWFALGPGKAWTFFGPLAAMAVAFVMDAAAGL
jgi:hypothetical protein